MSASKTAGAIGTIPRQTLYELVRHSIQDRILAGHWRPGQKIPPEQELARQAGVSTGTVRKALEWLAAEGVVQRRQGVGTFVATFNRQGFRNVFQPFQSTDGRRRYDERRLVRFERLVADAETAGFLAVEEGTPLIHTVRHFLRRDGASGTVVSVDESYLNARYFPKFTEAMFLMRFRPDDSLYKFYDREFGVVITSQRCRLRFEMLSGREAQAIGMPGACAVVTARRISMALGRTPVEYRINRMDARNLEISFDL